MRHSTFRFLLLGAFAGPMQLGDMRRPVPGNTTALIRLIDLALANNPELSIMQARIEQADAQLGQAMASFYPQIKTSLSYQYSNNPAQAFAMLIAERRLNFAGTDFNHPGFVEDYRPSVTASYSLFRGGQDYYQSQAAQLGIEASELEKSATRNRLLNNVTAAYYGELAAIQAHKVSQRSIESVQSELDQSRVRYRCRHFAEIRCAVAGSAIGRSERSRYSGRQRHRDSAKYAENPVGFVR